MPYRRPPARTATGRFGRSGATKYSRTSRRSKVNWGPTTRAFGKLGKVPAHQQTGFLMLMGLAIFLTWVMATFNPPFLVIVVIAAVGYYYLGRIFGKIV